MFYRISAIYMGKHFVFMAEFIISFCCAFFHLNSCLQHYNLEVARGNRIDAHDILFSPTLIMMIVLLSSCKLPQCIQLQ